MKRFGILLLILFGISIFSYSKSVESIIKDGDKFFSKNDFINASINYNQAYNLNNQIPNEIKEKYANSLYYLHNNIDAVKIFEEIPREIMSDESLVNYANLIQLTGEYEKSIDIYKLAERNAKGKLKLEAEYGKNTCLWGLKNSVSGESIILPTKIPVEGQSNGVQYYKQNKIVFSVAPLNSKVLTLALSEYVDSESEILETPLSKIFSTTPWSLGAVSFSNTEPREMYFSVVVTNKKKKGTVIQIYVSQFINGDWTSPKPFKYNSEVYSVGHPAISSNGKVLFFSSTMFGGQGGIDIWRVEKVGADWGKPVNIGKTVNTNRDEFFPYLDEKNMKLYFSSNGMFGYGGHDIYVIDLNKSYEPIGETTNLKKPINSAGDDFAFVLNSYDSTRAFLSSNRENGSTDIIYDVEFKEVPKDQKVNFVQTDISKNLDENREDLVIDDSLKTPLFNFTSDYAYQDLLFNVPDTQKVIIKKDTIFGKEKPIILPDFIMLPEPKLRPINISDTTILEMYNLNKKPEQQKVDRPIKKTIIIEKNVQNIINKSNPRKIISKFAENELIAKLYFRKGSHLMDKDAKYVLNEICEFMNANPKVKIRLIGYTDCYGNKVDNIELGTKRAIVVRNYLVYVRRINPFRIKLFGYGEESYSIGLQPYMIEERIHAKKRRVEVRID